MFRTGTGVLFLLGVLWALPVNGHQNPITRIQELNTAILRDPLNPHLVLERAELRRRARDFGPARSDLDLAMRLGADVSRVSLVRGVLLFDQGQFPAAIQVLDGLAKDSPRVLSTLGRAHRALGRNAIARDYLARAIEASPSPHPDLYLELARLAVTGEDEDPREALFILDDGLGCLGPVSALIHMALDLETAASDHDAALRRLDRLPSLSLALLKRKGEILMLAGRLLEAQAVYTQTLAQVQALPHHRRATPAMQDLEHHLRCVLETQPKSGNTP